VTEYNFENLQKTAPQNLYIFNVYRDEDSKNFLLQPLKNAGEEMAQFNSIAILNQEANRVLSEITLFCTFSAYSSTEQWDSVDETSKAEKNTYVFIDLVVYGDQDISDKVGGILDSNKVFLQDPDHRNLSLVYENPHFMDLEVDPNMHTGLDVSMLSFSQADTGIQLQFSAEQATTQKLLKQKINSAFKTMTRAQNLKRTAANMRVRTPLLE